MLKKKIAVFDVDGTIFRSSLLVELTDALVQEGIFPPQVRDAYNSYYQRWLDRQGPYGDYIQAVIDEFEKNAQGVRMKDFLRVAGHVGSFHRNRTYRYTRDLVAELKKKKYYLLAISGSPKVVVDVFAKYLGFDKIYARMQEVDKKNRLTGRTMHEGLINDKAQILLRAVEHEGLSLRNSIGVGDTMSDVSFLEMVTKPICFNPNRELYDYAKKKGWKIVVERKDVVYSL